MTRTFMFPDVVLGAFLFAFLLVSPAHVVHAGGEAESGREATIAMVEEGSYVASSYIDLESILDDYSFPYEAREDSALSVYLDLEKPLIPEWGDSTMLQVSLVSNRKEYFPEAAIDYIVFPYSTELFEDRDLRRGLRDALVALVAARTEGQSVWVFLRKDGELVELSSADDVNELLSSARRQLDLATISDAVRRVAEAEKDLQAILEAAGELREFRSPRRRPAKLLWILDKPIANTTKDFRDVSAIIAGYGDSDTEISFCGHGEEFRAQSVNTFVEQFGGNSYYVTDGRDLKETIASDFAFYSRPAVSDLAINVHALGPVANKAPARQYRLVTMGPEEYHVFFAELNVPSRLDYTKARLSSLGAFSRQDVEQELRENRSYPLAYLTISYYDHSQRRAVHDDMVAVTQYTNEFRTCMAARTPGVLRNLAILDTYKLFGSTAAELQRGNYVDPLIELNSHIKRLERLNETFADELIAEDITLLRQYKKTIVENKDNPLRGLKTWREIRARRY